MKAILVSVDYADILDITLPYNRHHFSDIVVVTTPEDIETRLVALRNACRVHMTNAFYTYGADFNKWAALEEGIDVLGRRGNICIMDADVLIPKLAVVQTFPGFLQTPLRRMMVDLSLPVPEEATWHKFPLHPQQREFAGYMQVFSAEDTWLGPSPWHQTTWRHAGGADSFFQDKWPQNCKIRPGYEVLHLGQAGVNWCGRSSKYVDGTTPKGSLERFAKLKKYIFNRRFRHGRNKFEHEKIVSPPAESGPCSLRE